MLATKSRYWGIRIISYMRRSNFLITENILWSTRVSVSIKIRDENSWGIVFKPW